MAEELRGNARAGTTSQSVAKEVVACLAAHTGLQQTDFRNKRKIKRFAAGGKRRGALIRALLARPALKQLGVRQQDFDKAELSGKSTVGDIIGVITVAAKAAKMAKPPKKKAKTRARTASGTTRRPVKASRTAKATKKTKQVAASKPAKPVVRTSKARTAKKTARTGATPKPISASPTPISTRTTGATSASRPRLDGDAKAARRAKAPRAERAPRTPGAPRASRAEAPGPSNISGSEEMAFEANVPSDRRADLAAEPQASYVADVLLRDADRDGPQPG